MRYRSLLSSSEREVARRPFHSSPSISRVHTRNTHTNYCLHAFYLAATSLNFFFRCRNFSSIRAMVRFEQLLITTTQAGRAGSLAHQSTWDDGGSWWRGGRYTVASGGGGRVGKVRREYPRESRFTRHSKRQRAGALTDRPRRKLSWCELLLLIYHTRREPHLAPWIRSLYHPRSTPLAKNTPFHVVTIVPNVIVKDTPTNITVVVPAAVTTKEGRTSLFYLYWWLLPSPHRLNQPPRINPLTT